MVADNWRWDQARKFCGRELPYQLDQVELNNANKLRLIFRSNNDVNGDGFTVI